MKKRLAAAVLASLLAFTSINTTGITAYADTNENNSAAELTSSAAATSVSAADGGFTGGTGTSGEAGNTNTATGSSGTSAEGSGEGSGTESSGAATSAPAKEAGQGSDTEQSETDASAIEDGSAAASSDEASTEATTAATATTAEDAKEEYTITFDANGGLFSDAESTEAIVVTAGEAMTELPEEPTMEDCDFTGWYTEPEPASAINSKAYTESQSAAPISFDDGFIPTEDETFYAGWEETDGELKTQAEVITGDVSRISWIQSLISVFNLSVSDYDLPDNYYTDISESDTYYNDILLAEAVGIADAEAGTEFLPNNAADREFAVASLNELLGYILSDNSEITISDIDDFTYTRDIEAAKIAVQQGWFVLDSDSKFLPDKTITSDEAASLIDMAKDKVAKDKADLDKKSTSGFKDGVIVVPNGTEVSRQNTYDSEDNITSSVVTVIDMPQDITVKEGDLFAVYYNNIPVGYTAKSVSVSEGTYVIKAERADDDVIFEDESVSLSGTFEASPTDIIAAEGVSLSYSDSDTGELYTSAEEIPYSVDENGNKVYEDYTLRAQSTIEVADGVSITYDYKLKEDPKVTFDISHLSSDPHAIVDISFSSVYTVSCDVTEELSDTLSIPTIPLFYLDLAGIGQFMVSSDIDVNGSFTATKETDHNIHIYADKSGIRINHSENAHPIGAEAVLNFKAGVEMELALKEIPMVSARIYVDAGVKANVRSHWYNDDKTPGYCLNLSTWLYAEGGAYASVNLDIPGVDNPNYSKTFFRYDDTNSPVKTSTHVEDGVEVSTCSRASDANCPGIGFNSRGYVTKSSSKWHGVSYTGTNKYTTGDGTVVSNYKYTVDSDGNATITGRNGAGSSLVIPGTIDGHKVIAIADSAFKSDTTIRTVIIPDSVTKIGSYTFNSCSNLTNLTLSKNLVSIDYGAFSQTAISEITIPKSLTKAVGLANTTSGGAYIAGIFSSTNLKKVYFEEGTTQIPGDLFSYCSSLEEITIPDTVTTIGYDAFYHDASLKRVTLSKNLVSISDEAFRYTAIDTIVIPDSVTKIGSYTFNSCSNLTNLTLSKNLVSIDYGAFSQTAISEITIPKSLTKAVGLANTTSGGAYIAGIFSSTNLKKVYFEEGTTQIPGDLFSYCSSLEEITIPDTVTTIGYEAFAYDSSLTTVNFPTTLQTLGDGVFRNCTSLQSIVIPDSVTGIGDGVFRYCTKLKKVQLPEVRINIASYTFDGCTALTDVNIPDTLQYVRSYAFHNCSALTSITLPQAMVGIENYAFYNCDALANVEVKSTGSASIGSSAFEDCDVLSSVKLADGVSSLGTSIFNSCDALTDVSLGTGLTSIPSNAFPNCGSLEKITIPYNVTTISSNAFINDPKLTQITIPRKTTSIADTLFSYPSNMTIYGVSGTTAETYANNKGIAFVDSSVTATTVSFAQSSYDVLVGKTIKLSPTIEPSNFTDEISWKVVGTTGNITIDSNGLVKGVKVGQQDVKIIVENDSSEISAVAKINVIQPVTSISVIGSTYSIEGGTTLKLTAKVYPSTANDSSVSWTSSDETVATVDDNGLVSSLKKGSATIKATANDGSGVYGSRTITVTSTATVVTSVDELQSAHKYENNTNETWIYKVNGANYLQVTFSNDTSVEDGADYIYLKDKSGNAVGDGTYTGTVLAGRTLIVTGDSIRINLKSDDSGRDYGFAVTNVSALDKLPTDYTVKFNANGGAGSMDDVSIAVGATSVLPANAFSYTGKTFDKWNTSADGTGSSYTDKANVKNLCNNVGESITLYAQWKVVPVTSVTLSSKSAKMIKGDSIELSVSVAPADASDKTVIWSADPAGSVSIISDGLNATITATASVGKVAIKAVAVGGASDTCEISIDKYAESVTVTPAEVTIDKGNTTTLSAAILPADVSDPSVVWISEDPDVAAVDKDGKVAAIGGGTATIVATSGDGKASGQSNVTVLVAASNVSLDRTLVSLNKGEEDGLTATVLPLDTTDKTISWMSDNNSVASVDNDGKIIGLSVGETTIKATTANGKTLGCKVIVGLSDLDKDNDYDSGFDYPEGLWISGLEYKNEYTGSKVVPDFNVYYGKTLLKYGTEYSVSYTDNTNAGTATITISGKGNYTGKVTKSFEITPVVLSDINVDIAPGVENKGKPVKPSVTVSYEGKKLKENKDYRVSYDQISSAGSTDVTIAGIGNYSGTIIREFVVKAMGAADLKSAVVTGYNKKYSYDEAKSLIDDLTGVHVLLKKTDITDDCNIVVENADRAGTATIVISPKNDSAYVGEKRVTFKVDGTKLGYITVDGIYGYTGDVNSLSVNVYSGKKNAGVLVDPGAYTLNYSTGLTNAGTVTVTAVGNAESGYTGKVTAKVKITAQDINDESKVKITIPTAYYSKGGSRPAPVISYNGWTLREGVDYTLKYANNTTVSGKKEPSVTVTGRGNYSGKRTITYSIGQQNIGNMSIASTDVVANSKKKGTYYCSAPKIYDIDGKLLQLRKDYTVRYINASTNTEIGKNDIIAEGSELRVEITGIGNYTGTAMTDYQTIAAQNDINKVKADKIDNMAYTGKAVNPDSVGLWTGTSKNRIYLVEGTDYVLTDHYNNVNKGTASVRIEGIGNYSGSRIMTYKIVSSNAGSIWQGSYNKLLNMIDGKTADSVTIEDQTLNVGEKTQLRPVFPDNCDSPKVAWKSSNTKTATIDKNGNITAKKAGVTTITATISGTKINGTATITVR